MTKEKPWERANTDWFRDCGWGVFVHYLTTADVTAEEWNRQVDSFDVNKLANQLEEVGAPYFYITVGQNSGHWCAPNETYDKYVQVFPSKCSKRDLVMDLYDALNPKGIKLLVYIPGECAKLDPVVMERLGGSTKFTNQKSEGEDTRMADFQIKWEEIISEWSHRWGNKVKGWWVDGCYDADFLFRHPDRPNFRSYSEAMKAGNPEAIVAYNTGIKCPVICSTEYEDYTAGELTADLPIGDWNNPGDNGYWGYGPNPRFVDGAQYHILNFLGKWWSQSPPRFPDELAVGYTKYIMEREGVVSWDIPTDKTGRIPDDMIAQLKKIGKATGKI